MRKLTTDFNGFWALMGFNAVIIIFLVVWLVFQGLPWDWIRDGLLITMGILMNVAIFLANRKK